MYRRGSPDREQRGGLHLDRERARGRRGGMRVVEQVDADDRADMDAARRGAHVRPPRSLQRLGELRVGEHTISCEERPRGAVEADGLARDHEVAEREVRRERAAGADADQPPRAERDQLRQDDRRRGAAHARRLDRERLAVGARGAGVAPEAAMVVEHQRLLQQRLRERERAPGVAGQQHPLGQRRGRAQVDRLGVPRRGGGVVASGTLAGPDASAAGRMWARVVTPAATLDSRRPGRARNLPPTPTQNASGCLSAPAAKQACLLGLPRSARPCR